MCMLALTRPEAPGHAFNVGSGQPYTVIEIAERLGEPLGTVKTRARAALKGLRVMLAGVGAPELAGRMSGGPDVQHARPVDGAPRG